MMLMTSRPLAHGFWTIFEAIDSKIGGLVDSESGTAEFEDGHFNFNGFKMAALLRKSHGVMHDIGQYLRNYKR